MRTLCGRTQPILSFATRKEIGSSHTRPKWAPPWPLYRPTKLTPSTNDITKVIRDNEINASSTIWIGNLILRNRKQLISVRWSSIMLKRKWNTVNILAMP
uniref:Uncharacterized protein n=1 Tax=Cacopsylla melanoneura TaxID=428564 RepID=A0A8D8WX44_9HEMI